MRRIREALAVGMAAAGLALASASGSAGAEVRLAPVGGAFEAPVAVTGAPGDDQRLYVVEQAGVVKVVRGGTATVFADLRADVLFGGEQGLLGIAFAPDFATSRLLYVYFTDRAGDNRVEELRAPTSDAVDPASRRLVLRIPHPGASNHNGGTLAFGPDGLLYLAPGDGARGANARDLTSLLGKVLRIDPRGGFAGSYTVPADNPFAAATDGRRREIWASGLRNPFRFAFDRATGDLIVGDVGEGTTEELSLLPAAAGRGRGADLGWPVCEGSFLQGSTTRRCDLAGATPPIVDRFASDGWHSIVAGPVVRDPSLPSLAGRILYGDYFVPEIRAVSGASPADDRPVGVAVRQLTSFGEDAAGCVYATSAAGQVLRLVEQDARIPCALAPAPPVPVPDAPSGGDGDGGSGRPGGEAGAPAPGLRARVARSQRVLRTGRVVVGARCRVACRLTAGATLRVGRRAIPLRRAARRATAGRAVRLAPRLTRRGRAVLRRALRDGRRATVVVRVRARTADGRASRLVRATVRVRR